jgi:hypothetical protein
MKYHLTPLLVHASLNLLVDAQGAPTFVAGDLAQYNAPLVCYDALVPGCMPLTSSRKASSRNHLQATLPSPLMMGLRSTSDLI